MSKALPDPVGEALSVTLRLKELAEICSGAAGDQLRGKPGDAVYRRAREVPELIASSGLVPAMTLYMAKGPNRIYETIYSYLAGLRSAQDVYKAAQDDGRCGTVCGELADQSCGYAALLAAVSLFASRAFEALSGASHDVSDYKSLATMLSELHSDGRLELAVTRLTIEYLLEIKKLAEAFWG